MAMAALREASRRLVSRRESPAAYARPFLLTHSRGITYRLFIGGLSQFATEDSLAEAFSQYGQVLEATIVTDKMTNRPKGFGFVLNGRVIYVDIAKAKMNRTTDSSPRATGPPKPPDRC
uniref:RRM domain-containing protein n=4 Tax=Oryza TaxID=4527 RepID=A0A0D3FVN9_9ORYZ